MLTISYTTTVTLRDLFECCQKCSKQQLLSWLIDVTFFKTHALLNDGLDKVLCRMRNLILETLYEVLFLEKKVL